jgi:hypothetical protein
MEEIVYAAKIRYPERGRRFEDSPAPWEFVRKG